MRDKIASEKYGNKSKNGGRNVRFRREHPPALCPAIQISLTKISNRYQLFTDSYGYVAKEIPDNAC
jgi:hypothetical protein